MALTHSWLSLSGSLVLRQMVTAKPVISVVYNQETFRLLALDTAQIQGVCTRLLQVNFCRSSLSQQLLDTEFPNLFTPAVIPCDAHPLLCMTLLLRE